jgi:hypothetical protein
MSDRSDPFQQLRPAPPHEPGEVELVLAVWRCGQFLEHESAKISVLQRYRDVVCQRAESCRHHGLG